MIVSDFIVYPDQFPFHSLHCLVHPSCTTGEIAKIHTQDIVDDQCSVCTSHSWPAGNSCQTDPSEYVGWFASSRFKTRLTDRARHHTNNDST